MTRLSELPMVLETDDGVRPLGPALQADASPGAAAIAIIPGDDVSLHRLLLVEEGPALRLTEARMRATDLSAQPIEDVHVAVGPADSAGASWVALIDRQRMAAHLDHLRAAGTEVRHMVPAALLLSDAGEPGLARLGDRVLLRTDEVAGLVEPSLAAALAGTDPNGGVGQLAEFGPENVPDPLPLDLLQGEFAPRRRWWRESRFRWTAGFLSLLVVLLLLAPLLIERVRSTLAVAAYDRATIELASQTLGTRPADAQAAAEALAVARRSAEGVALGARLSHAARTIEQVPGARLESARLSPDGTLLLMLGGPADALNRVGPLLAEGPFVSTADGPRVSVGDRQAARAANDSLLSEAMLRLVTARQDAALTAAGKVRPPMPRAMVAASLAAAGLADPATPASGAIQVPAARSTTLLPLIADLELKGARFTTAEISRNADSTLSASLGVSP